jgi:hypothetical protein
VVCLRLMLSKEMNLVAIGHGSEQLRPLTTCKKLVETRLSLLQSLWSSIGFMATVEASLAIV